MFPGPWQNPENSGSSSCKATFPPTAAPSSSFCLYFDHFGLYYMGFKRFSAVFNGVVLVIVSWQDADIIVQPVVSRRSGCSIIITICASGDSLIRTLQAVFNKHIQTVKQRALCFIVQPNESHNELQQEKATNNQLTMVNRHFVI